MFRSSVATFWPLLIFLDDSRVPFSSLASFEPSPPVTAFLFFALLLLVSATLYPLGASAL